MNNTVLLNISIETTPQEIWKVLADEKHFNACFETMKMNCNDWKIGGNITFETPAKNNIEHAIINYFNENERLSYGYKKEEQTNQIEVTFSLKPAGDFTYLTIEGKNFRDEYERSHSEIKWINMMQDIKKYVQKK
ncbi:Activator of Hsp90 ATPase homolog 1-like protein [Algoriella xinjiangensis]|uniref:Activator of Hsp90 ATPase homolog 1-like protein n=1 Tax=Algoriella xinjiangensis TaxID=684065 RepID=A0A1I4Y3X8_9FLAO|nr:SRPBCC domain-containing protein [Algoriella xinjiangensis]SFN32200.1 Activator of Hsp90 ATPase homolog 1-like protein [Algoriella xinjiangensis]VDH15323.1 Activator of Hsp90 ATPase homolog 1-like protein [Algoriella xinjiangensis]